VERIALFLPNWIGDVVMATPAVRAVRERFPAAHLIAVCKPYVSALLDGSPWFNQVILSDKRGPRSQRSIAVITQLRQHRPDAAVLFSNSFRTAVVAWLGGCRQRVGFARYGRSPLLTDRLNAEKDAHGRYKPMPIINDYNRLVRPLGVNDPGHRLELHTTSADEHAAAGVWAKHHLQRHPEVIAFNTGGAFGSAKQWPVESFVQLARQCVERRGSAVLVLCGPSERDVAREIVSRAKLPQVVSLADEQLSLGLSKACVKRADLLVTTDSGPRHFAAAFDRPVVTLFGPTFIEWTDTFFSKAINLQKKVPCGPCQQRECPLDHACMRDLCVNDVFRAAEELLDDRQEVRHAG